MAGATSFNPWAMLASVVVSSLMNSSKKKSDPQQPTGVTPPPEPQAPKTPDEAARRSSVNVGAAAAGQAGSTLLSGTDGVSPSTLSLGKNSLLGQ